MSGEELGIELVGEIANNWVSFKKYVRRASANSRHRRGWIDDERNKEEKGEKKSNYLYECSLILKEKNLFPFAFMPFSPFSSFYLPFFFSLWLLFI